MIQRCEQSGFASEARHAIDVLGERWRQDLQRDVALQLRVARTVHFAHPAGPEGTEDLVDADARAWRNSHRRVRALYGRDGATEVGTECAGLSARMFILKVFPAQARNLF